MGAEEECPEGGGFACSFLIYPGYTRVKGHMNEISSTQNCPGGIHAKPGNWEAEFPRKDKAGNAVWTSEKCTCGNLEHWADEGHPAKLCIEDCVAPN